VQAQYEHGVERQSNHDRSTKAGKSERVGREAYRLVDASGRRGRERTERERGAEGKQAERSGQSNSELSEESGKEE
jgi:hypothetical protein